MYCSVPEKTLMILFFSVHSLSSLHYKKKIKSCNALNALTSYYVVSCMNRAHYWICSLGADIFSGWKIHRALQYQQSTKQTSSTRCTKISAHLLRCFSNTCQASRGHVLSGMGVASLKGAWVKMYQNEQKSFCRCQPIVDIKRQV